MLYLTSDLHFNHDRDFIYKPRGFETVNEMNQAIIENWNTIATEKDDVYVLGDLMLGDSEKGKELLSQLKGNIHIILGNHDTTNRIKIYNSLPNIVDTKYANILKYKKYTFYLSHFPTFTGNLDYDKPLKARLLDLFGHTHSSEKFYEDIPTMYNVALDAHDNKIVSIETAIEDMETKFKSFSSQRDIDINIKPYVNFIDRCREKL